MLVGLRLETPGGWSGRTMRSGRVYTLQPSPRRKPTRVIPTSAASSTASDDGADTAASTGMPAIAAFCVSSKLARPLTISTCPASGSRPWRTPSPITLSTALCRPTSSRRATSSPSTVNSPAACSPPVLSNTCWAARSRSGRASSVASGRRRSSPATSCRVLVRIASMLALPHTPQELDV